MYLRKRLVNNTYYWSLVESYREQGKVKQRIIKSLGNTNDAYNTVFKHEEYSMFAEQIYSFLNNVPLTVDDNDSVQIERKWCMANKNTFKIKPIKDLIKEEMTKGIWIDPFANDSKIATITNDLNPEYDTDYHMDALEFLKMFNDESIDGVFYDPPYSPRQVKECYDDIGIDVTKEDTKMSFYSKHKDEIARILKPNGKTISCGWSSQGIGKTRGFKLNRVLIVAHGGHRNDTIVTVETKLRR